LSWGWICEKNEKIRWNYHRRLVPKPTSHHRDPCKGPQNSQLDTKIQKFDSVKLKFGTRQTQCKSDKSTAAFVD
jgi:hypothetical protein